MLLLTNGLVITFNAKNQVIDHGAIAIDGSIIQEIGATPVLEKKYPTAKKYNAHGKLILPGMINPHTHLYSAFACGMPISGTTASFSQILKRIWWKLDRALTVDDIYYSALVTGIQAIKSGTTTIFDHHSSPAAIPNSLDSIAQAILKLGLRACLCYEVSDRDGKRTAQQGIQENVRWIEKVGVDFHPLLSATFGLHASFTLTETTLKQAAALGNRLHSGFHIHLAEDAIDQTFTKKKYRKSVVYRLADLGILGKKTIAAHGIHISKSEMDILKQTETIIIHNPGSNMNNAVGIAPVPDLLKKDILVGLGTDGLGNDMFTELRFASLAHKFANCDPRVFPPDTVIQLAVKNNRKIASRFFPNPLGMLTPGSAADIIIVNQHTATKLSTRNINSQLVYGILPTRIDTVFIQGNKVLENGKMLTVNEPAIYQQAQKLASRLWNRL